MEETLNRIKREAQLLERKFNASSFSFKKNLLIEMTEMLGLCDNLGLDFKITCDYKIASEILNKKMRLLFIYYNDFIELSKNIINIYKTEHFEVAENDINSSLEKQEMEEIIKDYLSNCNKKIYEIYKELIDDKRIIRADINDSFSGASFSFNSINSHYILINNNYNYYIQLETLIHELGHIYSSIFLNNYNSRIIKNYDTGFYSETIPLYLEMSLHEFMKNHGYYHDDVIISGNWINNNRLQECKCMRLYCECFKKEYEEETYLDESFIKELNKCEKNKIYKYDINDIGTIDDFKYVMSVIHSSELFENELNGENVLKNMNNFLLSFYDDQIFERDISDMDVSSLRRVLKKNNEEIYSIIHK